jgi:Ca2+-binding RTX toxin-like protein
MSIPTSGNDLLIGTSGADVIDGLDGNDEILGLGGNDTLSGGAGDDVIYGDDGNDTITDTSSTVTYNSSSLIRGGGGDDIISVGNSTSQWSGTVYGDAGNDTLYLNNVNGQFYGGDGADIFVLSGTVSGSLFGGLGADRFTGSLSGYGYPNISAGDGANEVSLQLQGPGYLYFSAGSGDDVINLTGTRRESVSIYAGDGNNSVDLSSLSLDLTNINYTPSSVMISTGSGADTIRGSAAADTIFSGGGADSVNGGAGDDQITGGADADTLTGGTGIDTFVGTAAEMNGDRITDYQYGDRILLTDSLVTASQVRLAAAVNGLDTEVQIDADNNGSFETVIALTGKISGRVVLTTQENSTITPMPPGISTIIRIINDGISLSSSILLENNTAGVVVGSISINAPEVQFPSLTGPFSYSLIAGTGDADNSSFTIVGDQLSINTVADFEVKSNYSIRLRVTDAIGITYEQVGTIFVDNVNEAPTINSDGGGPSAALLVEENSLFVTTIGAADPDVGSALTYSIVGGADAAKFLIDESTGALSFIARPDFELPSDAGSNNVFEVVVLVSDGALSDSQAISITITNQTPDVLYGSSGPDVLIGTSGNDVIDGLEGNDEIFGLEGNDTLIGGAGDDIIYGDDGNDTIVDTASGSPYNSTSLIQGGLGDDIITVGTVGGSTSQWSGLVYGGGGNDTIYINNANGQFYGGEGNNTFILSKTDYFYANIEGGSGTDRITGSMYGSANINLGGGANEVNLALQSSGINLNAGSGADTIALTGTRSGDVRVAVGDGNNSVDLSELYLAQPNFYYGSVTVSAGSGSDTIRGSSAVDIINSGAGLDAIDGGVGRDQITGGAGADTLTGGDGFDTFTDTVANMNGDRITDYQYGERILLTQSLSSAAQVRLSSIANSLDARLEIDANNDGVFETAITLAGQVSGRVVVTSEGDYTNNLIRIVNVNAPVPVASAGDDLLIGTAVLICTES